jgi:predicted Ser/Thr protein kinase
MTILVVWCTNPTDSKVMAEDAKVDHWQTCENMLAAKELYEKLCERDNVYSVSIAGVLESSDHSTFALPELASVDLKVLQAFLLLPKELRTRFMDVIPVNTDDNLVLAFELLEKV